ncbi:MAG TPA: GGDEF domain-containing protein [Verrucomicrobiae bacterium]|nr:GGDEF domain-containing protein [Verrucomicrobiae bacterium]
MSQQARVPTSAVYRSITPGAVAIVATTAFVVLTGWAIENDYLKRIVPGLVAMNPLTALGFLGAAAALWRLNRGKSGTLLATLVTLAGAAKLCDLTLGTALELDQVLFTGQLAIGGAVPNRMAPNTALCMLLAGTALLLLGRAEARALVVAQSLAVFVVLLSLLAVVGYTYRISALYGVGTFIPMALHTATSFLVLAAGILFARPGDGLMSIVTSDTAGGLIARLLLPAAILIPIAVGWLPLAGQRAGLFNLEVGVALFVVANVLMLVALIWWNAALLYRTDLQRRDVEQQLVHNAQHDALTGLYNRAHFMGELERAAARSGRNRAPLGVCYLDIDGFKQVNDTLGHEAGDRLLQEFAARLLRCCRTGDTCARLGGDEFTVVSEASSVASAQSFAERLLTELSQPYEHIAPARVGVSIGVALSGESADSPQELLHRADTALYAAKRSGKGRYCLVSPSVSAQATG